MASERKPELIIVDTLQDKHGRPVRVGYRGGDVEIIVTPSASFTITPPLALPPSDRHVVLDGEGRDWFIKAWAQAEIAAERHLCQAHPDDCPNGPESHPLVPPTAPDDVLPCCRQPWEAEAAPPAAVGDDEEELLTYDQAVALLPDGDRVHTFLDSPVGLIGADWDRADILALLAKTGRREVTGAAAQSMGHGLAAFREDSVPVFIATRTRETEADRELKGLRERATAAGRDVVEQAARELIGIPDGL